MPTLDIQSEGDAVKLWQAIVGTTIDGIFKRKDHNATILFQKRHNLTQTGVVDELTWQAALQSL